MKILAVSDRPSEYLWGPGVHRGLEGIDLILSSGDLDPRYLSYLATFAHAPVLYVHGNHDGRYEKVPPEGCICVDGRLYVFNGVRILGLGGSIRYAPGGPFQYTQGQMRRRARRRWLDLRRRRGFDILLTHAPAYGLGDGADWAHTGFQVFGELLDRWSPAYLVHGHTHLNYDPLQPRVRQYKNTQIVNAFERYVFDFDPRT